MTDLQERIDAVQEACDLAYADVVFAQCALKDKDDMVTEQTETTPEDGVVQEMTLIELMIGSAVYAATINFTLLLLRKYMLSSFEKGIVKQIGEIAKIVKDADGETDPKRALENFRKLKKALRKIYFKADLLNRNRGNYNFAHKKYYAAELKEIAKLSEIADTILDESKITKKRAKKSGNTDVFKVQLDELFKQANTVLEIIERAAKKRKSKADLPPEDGGADVNEAPETVEAETEPTENTEESGD